ncbi:flagellar hook-basal body protein FleE [Neokomagataea thailandica NBRC 106555]|uniref:Flagellar hook-basal body complex protein FliE n=2 Tax=Neokomagataea TaxID=1223423 RepID=A0A4Y6V4P1_9PROT|nr:MULTISPECIES: flagellar hook-basal body complex protein FliE [Neokomagataea]QDH25082.1 flagellar hook-basal body complex protein FliE [Neokomagataea tanensis]GBR54170.1 flagellar hook-basal body protein FleE [Neokomagataea thailandica NBRC 106555]
MITSLTQAHSAYAESLQRASTQIDDGVADGAATQNDFSSVLSQTLNTALNASHAAETQSAQGLAGHGDVTQIVTAVSNAQLTLQTTTVLRDRMVQAYQDIMKMAI